MIATAAPVRPALIDADGVRADLAATMQPGDVYEIRILNGTTRGDRYPSTLSGYFNNADAVVNALADLTSASGIYVTLNPVAPALLARAANRLRRLGKGDPTTADHDVPRRRFLPIDLDPTRPSGISATDDEHAAAVERGDAIDMEQGNEGWPAPIRLDTGNGAWLLYWIDVPSTDGAMLASVLAGLAAKYGDDAVNVDTTVHNPARIRRLGGTLNCKGDSTDDRPHRVARLLSVPDVREVVTVEQLKAAAVTTGAAPTPANGQAKASTNGRGQHQTAVDGKRFDVAGFITRHGLDLDGPRPYMHRGGTGEKWTGKCLFSTDHTDDSGWVIQYQSGAVAAGCSHDSCSWGWADLRERFEPKPDRKGDGALGSGRQRDASRNVEARRPAEPIPPCPIGEELDTGQADAPDPIAGNELVFDPGNPRPIARWYVHTHYSHPDGPTLLHDGAEFQGWQGTRWVGRPEAAVRADGYAVLEPAMRWTVGPKAPKLVPFAPNQTRINHFVDAVRSLTYTERLAPCWLSDKQDLPDPTTVIAATNGLVQLRPDTTARLLGPPTPLFYSPNALDYSFDPTARPPREWLRFLDTVWPGDRQSIDLLQEWFGYCLTPNDRQHKAMMMVGPRRAGKGTVARVLSRMIGQANVCGPTLAGLSQTFGLWTLLGKLLAVIADARLSNRADQAIIVERLLALTGGDAIEFERKYLPPVTAHTSARLMLLSNELPKFKDPSGALAGRFMVLIFRESFYGREDTGLEDRIALELPGILMWSIAGWQRLQQRGRFAQPASSAEAVQDLADLSSNVGTFVRDWCNVEPDLTVSVADLFDAWQAWCKEEGERHPGDKQTFGRDLTAAVAGIRHTRPRGDDGGRSRGYTGIGLTISAAESARVYRANHQGGRPTPTAGGPTRE